MIEKIGKEEWKNVSLPCYECLNLIKGYKQRNVPITVAEIGVGIGATSVEIAKILDDKDKFYLFDFEDNVLELKEDLKEQTYNCKNIYAMGNSRCTYDSYCWSLAKLYKENGEKEIFDVTYLDGAHTFMHDASTCCLLKVMTKKGGVVIFDDIDWSISNSPSMNPSKLPEVLNWYTKEQIETCQIAMVVNVFMKTDSSWELLDDYSSSHRMTFKKNNVSEISICNTKGNYKF